MIKKMCKNKIRSLFVILLLSMFTSNFNAYSATVLKDRGKNNNSDEDYDFASDEDDEIVDGETSNGRTIGTQLYDVKYYDSLDGKNRVFVAGGGGGAGSGGGAKKQSGSTAGSNTSLSDSGKKSKSNNIMTSDETSNKSEKINETMGFAKDDGEHYAEKEGSHAGKKVFELDRNGDLGLNENVGLLDASGLFGLTLFLAFGVGAVSFLCASLDVKKKKKSNYF